MLLPSEFTFLIKNRPIKTGFLITLISIVYPNSGNEEIRGCLFQKRRNNHGNLRLHSNPKQQQQLIAPKYLKVRSA